MACAGGEGHDGTVRELTVRQSVVCCAAAMLLFSQVPTAFSYLQTLDAQLFTTCNVICGSNSIGLLVLPFLYRNDIRKKQVQAVTRREWIMVMISAFLYSAMGPFFQFSGLKRTNVETLAMMQRVESVNLIAFTALLGDLPSRWSFLNCCSILIIIATYCVINITTLDILTGVLYLLASGWCFGISLMITRRELGKMTPGVVSVSRVTFGFIFYHIFSIGMGMQETIMQVYSFAFWSWMLWYGLLYVVGGQYIWTLALRNCSPSVLAAGMTALFPLQLFWAFLVFQRLPPTADLLLAFALLCVVASGALELLSKQRNPHPEPTPLLHPDPEQPAATPTLLFQTEPELYLPIEDTMLPGAVGCSCRCGVRGVKGAKGEDMARRN